MNHKKVYDALIQKRREHQVPETEYAENHHIIPKSEGGSDDNDNLIRLTAREHYIAHLLLAKIYNDNKMFCALTCMSRTNDQMERRFNFNSRLYELLKRRRSETMSKLMKGRRRTEEFKQHMKAIMKGKNKGKTPWNKGRKCSEAERLKTSEATKRAMWRPDIREKYLRGYKKRNKRVL